MKTQGKSSKKAAQPSISMSSPVPDAEAERRLRPVLDSLYAHNARQALKLVNQALQRRPGWPAARALRACIYLQMERWHEASQDVQSLRQDLDQGRVPVNEDAAVKLHMYYQEIRSEDAAAQVYEHAWRESPTDVKLAETAYCLYIRGGEFADAQKIAMKLHRRLSSSTQKYVYWATAAIWLGFVCENHFSSASGTPADARMLKLGCAMMSKALNSADDPPSPEIVRFATRVFKQSGDFDAAIRLVSHPLLVMDMAERLHLRADLAFNSTKSITDYHVLLMQYSPNDWEYWLRYLDSLSSSTSSDDWITQADDFIHNVLDVMADLKEPARGPNLARLELRVREKNWTALALGVVEYFRCFGEKAVVTRDLRPFLFLLKKHETLASALDEIDAMASEKGFPTHMHACWFQLWSGKFTDEPKQLVQRYLAIKDNGLPQTERQPSDEYMILAAHQILPYTIDPQKRLNNTVPVLKAIMMLEAALTNSPFNHDFKLVLMRLYAAVGGVDRMSELWDSLDVKHVQLSTLSHIVIRPFFDSGHHEALQATFDNINALWSEIDRQIPDCVTRAFLDGSLNSAVDFVLFRRRLEQSALLAEAMIIDAQLNLIQADGAPIGVKRALSILTLHPRFTVADLTGSKRLVTNEDTVCYKFWDFQTNEQIGSLSSVDEETTHGGISCDSSRVKALAMSLASLLSLLQLAEENGKDYGSEEEFDENEVSEGLLSDGDNETVPPLIQLRFNLARNLREVKRILTLVTSIPPAHANGITDPKEISPVESMVAQGQDLATSILDSVRIAVGDESQDCDIRLSFSKTLVECGKLAFDVMLIVAVAVSSFSRILSKAHRKAKKSSPKGDVKSPPLEVYESCRKVILWHRDALSTATIVIQEWLTTFIERGLDWTDAIMEHEDMADINDLIPEPVQPVRLADGSRETSDPISPDEFCRSILDGVQASHSVSCKTLMETLKAINNQLNLTDL